MRTSTICSHEGCTKSVYKNHPSGMCCTHRPVEARVCPTVAVRCTKCGDIRFLIAKDLKYRKADTQCFYCRNDRPKPQTNRKGIITNGQQLEVNGCLLIETQAGRCESYEGCKSGMWNDFFPDKPSCLDVAAKAKNGHGLSGWMCSKGSKPDLMSKEEEAQVRKSRLVAQLEISFLDAYVG